jgi:hypothetical protein
VIALTHDRTWALLCFFLTLLLLPLLLLLLLLLLQVIFALPAVGETDFTMRIFNSDGSEPEMCGNGIRCLARFVADVDKQTTGKYKIHTLAGAAGGGVTDVRGGCCLGLLCGRCG